MRIAICDDDLREQEQIEKALQGWDPTRSAEKYFSGASLLAASGKSPPFDIVFLDIYIPGENGVEIARMMKNVSPETEIVFVTTSESHAVDAFSLNALHYLVKPVTTQGVIEAFRRLAQVRARQRETISLSVDGSIFTVFLSQICSLESRGHVVEAALDDGRRLKTRTPLHELEQQLGRQFLKINRGIMVNMDHIESMGKDYCVLRNGNQMFLATRKRSAIRTAYHDHLMNRLSHVEDF